MSKKILIIVILLVLGWTSYAFAGAWTVPEGHWYAEFYTKYYEANSEFDANGNDAGFGYNGKSRELSNELKLEYGVRDDFNILVAIPYKYAKWKDDFKTQTTDGISDIWVRAKYRYITAPPGTASVQLSLKCPTNYNENDVPSLGTGQVDGEVRFLFGATLPSVHSYSGLEIGFKGRTEERANEVVYLAEYGYMPTDYLLIKGLIEGVEGVSGTGNIDQDYTKFDISLIFKLAGGGWSTVYRDEPSVNLELGWGRTFAGKNTSEGKEYIINLTSQF